MTQLSDQQIDKLSDIMADFGSIMLASVALPTILQGFQLTLFIFGGITTLLLWSLSIWLVKGK